MPEQKKINPHKGHRTRMKRQFIRGGIEQFEPHQVLELLLFFAIPQRDTNPIAHRLLDRFGDLASVLDADYEELCRVDGISEHSATLLVLCGQLLLRHSKEKADRRRLITFAEIKEFVELQLINEKCEKVLLLSLNNRLELVNCTVVNSGTIDSAEANTRELVQAALRNRATAVVVAHNHPAGFCLPSEEDVTVTKSFIPIFKMMNIAVLDHIIVAPDASFSMRNSPHYAPLFSDMVSRLDKRNS